MNAIKAIYDGESFKPMQPIPVNEDYEVIITFVRPIKKDDVKAMVGRIVTILPDTKLDDTIDAIAIGICHGRYRGVI